MPLPREYKFKPRKHKAPAMVIPTREWPGYQTCANCRWMGVDTVGTPICYQTYRPVGDPKNGPSCQRVIGLNKWQPRNRGQSNIKQVEGLK